VFEALNFQMKTAFSFEKKSAKNAKIMLATCQG
jgi:hypothetical protein